ncbi:MULTISPECIES: substrate-binding domain-containing protein [Anaerotruncus]|uniref:substrate-binding domain-containing protein n=1 Tax=Anaerotruncus TaxID=244127 RepID=UPI000C773ACF|nr:substrate-binding domain-containing protein [Anaerotruncus massiliensis (ex Togo et al. 2019)]
MKRTLAILLALTMAVTLLASCAQSAPAEPAPAPASAAEPAAAPETQPDAAEPAPAEKKDVVIAGIYKFADATWFINEGVAAGEKVKELGAKDWMYLDAKDDGNLFLQMVDTVIAQKVDGVICCPPDQTLSQVAVEKLEKAGIPVLAADDALIDDAGNKIAPWVGIDAYMIGQESAKWLVNYMQENNLVDDPECGIMIMTTDTVTSCIPRSEGQLDIIAEMLPDFPADHIFKTDYKMDLNVAFQSANGVIVANPQIKKWMVLTTGDEGTVGATRAIEQAGLADGSCTVGLGGYLAPAEFEKGSCFKAAAYFSALEVGRISAEHIMMMVNGEEPPKETAVSCIMVTKDNYKEAMPEYLQ